MSDLEDLDHGPDDLNLEEELSAPAGHTGSPAGGSSGPGKMPDKGALLKAAIVLAVVVAGGAYFMKAHSARPRQAEAPRPAQKSVRQAGSPAWGMLPSASIPRPPAARTAADLKPDLLPAAIPPLAGTSPPPSSQSPSSVPQIVNEMPPSPAQLAGAGNAIPPNEIPPAAIPSIPSSPSAALSPQFPPPGAPQASAILPQGQPAAPAGNKERMPSVLVPAVDKADLNKSGINTPANPFNEPPAANALNPAGPANPFTANAVPKTTGLNTAEPSPAAPASPAAPSDAQAKIEQLQEKIDELQKTISQLQQAAVVKEDTVEKSAEEAAPAISPVKRHHTKVASYHEARRHTRHAVSAKWVLRAAKPGVAWVAKKGSDDLHMVEEGDSLAGIGKVVSVAQDSSGAWVVRGTKGRIIQ